MERQKRHIILAVVLTLLLMGKTAVAQLSSKNYEIEARAHFGYLYFQNDEFHSALGRYSRYAPAFELSLHRNTYGEHRWEVLHNYPSIGLTFYYSPLSFRNDNISKYLLSDAFVFDGSYLRIKQIQLGYTLPQKLTRKASVEKIRFNVSLDNYFLFTNYPGLDPEISNDAVSGIGLDLGAYPTTKKIVFGISVTL